MVAYATRFDETPIPELNSRAMQSKLGSTMCAVIWRRKSLPPLPDLANSLAGFPLPGDLMQFGCQRHLVVQQTEPLQFCAPRELCAAVGA